MIHKNDFEKRSSVVNNCLGFEEENFGKFKPGKFRALSCKETIKPGYCLEGSKEGSIDRLGRGWSKDC